MPPPNLHPRSRMTSSLFATTLLASFLVVGIPHLIPCPQPRIAYADEVNPDGTTRRPRRRRRRCAPEEAEVVATTHGADAARTSRTSSIEVFADTDSGVGDDDDELRAIRTARRARRECPLPKPGGIIGEALGFKSPQSGSRKPGTNAEEPP